MQKTQIKVICLQLVHGFHDGCLSLLIPIMLNPYLCGQEDSFTGNARLLKRRTDLFLVKIALGSVNRTITDLQSIQHTSLTFFLRDLIYPVAQLRHFHAVI